MTLLLLGTLLVLALIATLSQDVLEKISPKLAALQAKYKPFVQAAISFVVTKLGALTGLVLPFLSSAEHSVQIAYVATVALVSVALHSFKKLFAKKDSTA